MRRGSCLSRARIYRQKFVVGSLHVQIVVCKPRNKKYWDNSTIMTVSIIKEAEDVTQNCAKCGDTRVEVKRSWCTMEKVAMVWVPDSEIQRMKTLQCIDRYLCFTKLSCVTNFCEIHCVWKLQCYDRWESLVREMLFGIILSLTRPCVLMWPELIKWMWKVYNIQTSR